MHVLPAKHSYAWLPRKCDYRTYTQTDRQTDAGQSDPYVPLRFAGDQKKKNSNNPVQTCYTFYFTSECRWGEVNWLFNVTINSTSVIYVTAHRCAGGLKKLDLRPGSQRHRLFVGFFKVPVQAWTLDQPFYTSIIPRNRSNLVAFYDTLGIRTGGHIRDLTPGSQRGTSECISSDTVSFRQKDSTILQWVGNNGKSIWLSFVFGIQKCIFNDLGFLWLLIFIDYNLHVHLYWKISMVLVIICVIQCFGFFL